MLLSASVAAARAAVLMARAAVLAAGVIRVVMAAVGRVARLERARQQTLNRRIRIALHAAVNADAELPERVLRTAADAAADQLVHAVHHQKARQQAVAASGRVEHPAGDDLALLHLIELERGAMAEVLKDLTVLVGNCNLHRETSCIRHDIRVYFAINPGIPPHALQNFGNTLIIRVFWTGFPSAFPQSR